MPPDGDHFTRSVNLDDAESVMGEIFCQARSTT
jgi:hypothetical protein